MLSDLGYIYCSKVQKEILQERDVIHECQDTVKKDSRVQLATPSVHFVLNTPI